MAVKILVIPWDAEPHVVEAEPDHTLKPLQAAVGGYIEPICLYRTPHSDDPGEFGTLWCNEDYLAGDGYVMVNGEQWPKLNHVANALAKAWAPHTLIGGGGLLGGCAVTGAPDDEGDTTSCPENVIEVVTNTWAKVGHIVLASAEAAKSGDLSTYQRVLREMAV